MIKSLTRALAILAITALTLTACGKEVPATGAPEDGVFASVEYGVSMTRPEGWTEMRDYMGTLVIFLLANEGPEDVFSENISLTVKSIDDGTVDLNEYSDIAVGLLEAEIDNFESLEYADYELGGLPGKKLVYTGAYGDVTAKWLQAWTKIDNNLYMFTFTAIEDSFDGFEAVVNEALDSIEFTD